MHGLHPDAVGTGPIRIHSAGLADLATDDRLDQPVPSCGDWLLADLVWHLAEVQTFWAWIIDNRPAGPESYVEPARPTPDQLSRRLREATDDLVSALDRADPTDEAWSWSDERTVGLSIRRQTHEAFVHHVDGILACGAAMEEVDPRLGADGVDELVAVMLSAVPPGMTFERTSGVIDLRTTDTDDNWTLSFGTAHVEAGGRTLDMVEVTPEADPDTVVEARAVELDLWLWGRAETSVVDTAGDERLVTRLRQVAAASTQ